jgi:hypothetical protein
MNKIDLFKTCKAYYNAAHEPELVTIEPATYLSIEGKGDPSGKEFAAHIEALYQTAYTLKFACKARKQDFVVAKLEAQWWFDEKKFGRPSMDEAPRLVPRDEWMFRLLIRMPDFITEETLVQSIETAVAKKKNNLLRNVKLMGLEEGRCVQILHVGPFDREPESLKKLMIFTEQHVLEKNGLHHEIYLSDFRKTPYERLNTILREPVK